jgi:uncharacterized linocin/CFP29 family protein
VDLLKRELAPIAPEAWGLIDDTAREVMKTHLTARRFVDVSGPHGLDHASVALGRLDVAEAADGVAYGIHRVLPLVELRVRFGLDPSELDGVLRGARDPELGPLVEAARRAALFEERAVFQGLAAAGIRGLLQAAERPAEPLPLAPDPFLDAISRAVLDLRHRGVQGPYVLVVGSRPFRFLSTLQGGYPLQRQVERLVEGPLLQSELLDGGLVASTRGGDAELVLGADFGVGYEHHTTGEVQLFVTESFTFRVLDPTAFVPLQIER